LINFEKLGNVAMLIFNKTKYIIFKIKNKKRDYFAIQTIVAQFFLV